MSKKINSNSKPLISIILCTYNRYQYLKEAIDSLNKKWAEISQKIYANNPQGNTQEKGSNTNDAASSQDNDIEDADFEVVDDDK